MATNDESRGLMSLLDWFANRRKSGSISQERHERDIADGLWNKCPECGVLAYNKDLMANQMVCLECGHHMRVDSNERIRQLIDANTWKPIDENLRPADPLQFRDRKAYSDRLREYQEKTGLNDAVQTGFGKIDGLPAALGVMDFRFLGGSMGSVVGEKLTRLIEQATQKRYPVVIVCASGGARMQEAMLSLMQMAKISAALERHRAAQLLYIPVLTNPTTGGVTASFAMLGDIILAEPKATIGFAGRRVIEQTLRQKLPDNFQTAEDVLEHGFVDAIVPRTQLKKTLAQSIALHQPLTTAPNLVHLEGIALSSSISS
ncbi:MAG: Acetyl-coenzyme A carboxylase carboxyl transferase subunit beta [Chroococcidiopsis cubana SAG 39.79]|jgi:acetyl-CoA carboxylase carboxyl transferase subunit beta|uniref:Acetyl-coenzyme A carboxylase carboxyl transferase subunit beta n=3 Tax=Chroococcidiopsis TaxID=54298 RepID=K9TT32_CHRTP|nr:MULTISPECIES: acetyl-CoA carboxylase, carboxyltransferase subunit beta [Chroococcidiopsis]PSB47537.1 acetyl-CoA carboxylase, carboxyltransferase subunit beta [Cyanosarcina cf. burmensis CCALA 770]AFY85987.1 acetyl-CoA carboxylase carboxyltransferase subunit alpha [Chroococcidiopsis thermalis PCC 7203]MDZ4873207.1 Acetyl-coenzyme A carboxylase carboxyl transferase subunit beta [Chroococcidiopsis cubana SAG 39.79]RUT07458.1 acetyl-coenzyme A carboxylase carboxyl transferase subunit beta [Chroo